MAKLGPWANFTAYIYMYIYIHTYIHLYAVESKNGPKIALFLSQQLSRFSYFPFVFQRSSSFCRENEINRKEKDKHYHFLSQASIGSIMLSNMLGPIFLNLGPVFDSNFLFFFAIVGFSRYAETTSSIAFSAKLACLATLAPYQPRFWPNKGPLPAHQCVYIYIYTYTYTYMLCGAYHLDQVWPFEGLLSGPSLFF